MFFKFVAVLLSLSSFVQSTAFEQLEVEMVLHAWNEHGERSNSHCDPLPEDSENDCPGHKQHCHSHCLFILPLAEHELPIQAATISTSDGIDYRKDSGFFEPPFRPPLA